MLFWYDTDKLGYLPRYQKLFQPLAHSDIRLLELGVRNGESLYLWRDAFVNGLIVGLDREPVTLSDPSGRIKAYRGEQQDRALLERIVAECAPRGFDIIIDDCSHLASATRASLDYLFPHGLKRGGIYVIEDWGIAYNAEWPDGAAHQGRQPGGHTAGLVGVLKELVDHVPNDGLPPGSARLPIRELTISPGMAVLRKG